MVSGLSEFLTVERYPEVSVLGEKQKGLNSNSDAKHMKLSKEYIWKVHAFYYMKQNK